MKYQAWANQRDRGGPAFLVFSAPVVTLLLTLPPLGLLRTKDSKSFLNRSGSGPPGSLPGRLLIGACEALLLTSGDEPLICLP